MNGLTQPPHPSLLGQPNHLQRAFTTGVKIKIVNLVSWSHIRLCVNTTSVCVDVNRVDINNAMTDFEASPVNRSG